MAYHVLSRSLTGALLGFGLTFAMSVSQLSPAAAQSDDAAPEVSVDATSGSSDEASGEPAGEPAPLEQNASDGDGPKADAAPPAAKSTDEKPSGSAKSDAPAKAGAPAKSEAAKSTAMDRLFAGSDKKDASKPAEVSPMLQERGADYYDKRAAEILKEDQSVQNVAQHPLSAAYPNQHLVICTAGCRDGTSAQIVSMVPKAAPVTESKPDSANAGVISCVGGCPEGESTTIAAMPANAGGTQVAATVGEWMTTVDKVPEGQAAPQPRATSGSGSGDWMNKINEERKPAAAEAAATAAPAAKTEEAKVAVTTPAAAPAPAAPAVATPAPASATAAAEQPAVVEKKVADTKAEEPKAVEQKHAEQKPAEMKPAAEAPTVTAEAKAPDVQPAAKAAEPAPVAQAPAPSKPAETPAAEAKPAEPAAPATKMAALETKPDAAPAVTEAPKAAEQPKAVEAPEASQAAAEPAAAASQETTPSLFKKSVKVAAKTEPAAEAKPQANEKVMSVLSEDQEMNAAIEKARGSLDSFWKSFETPGASESDFALKVAIQGNGATEHFWLTRIKRDGDKLSGLISNEPQSVKTVKMGQRYDFTADMISDWTFKRNGKLVGNETMRVLLPRMPEEQAAVYRQMYETP